MAVCAFIQMYKLAALLWGVAERSESFKIMIAGAIIPLKE